MSGEITVPQLGESIVEATVGQWLKHEGEAVSEGEPIVELETEKVNMEVVAPTGGVLLSIARREGETVAIGDLLARIGDAHDVATPAPPSQAAAAPTSTASEGTSVPAIEPSAPAEALPEVDSAESATSRATPLARRIASEHGVDLSTISGTGSAGRITHEDVNAHLQSAQRAQTARNNNGTGARPAPNRVAPSTAVADAPRPPSAATPVAPPVSAPARRGGDVASSANVAVASGATVVARPEERIRLSRRRLTIARRLVEAQQTAAMLTTFNEVDMSAIMDLRARRRDDFKQRHGVSLGFMSFFTRAVVGALKAYPRLNAEIQGEEMVLKRYYDIGIAVGVAEGLVVPVVRDADRLSFAEIEKQVASLAERARANSLSLSELMGGTFTITNGGTFGSLLSTPILNAPQVGILGMHKIEERPIALKGQVVIHPMMYVALSYDHRIVDGSEAVSFLVRVKQLLEDPEALLLEA